MKTALAILLMSSFLVPCFAEETTTPAPAVNIIAKKTTATNGRTKTSSAKSSSSAKSTSFGGKSASNTAAKSKLGTAVKTSTAAKSSTAGKTASAAKGSSTSKSSSSKSGLKVVRYPLRTEAEISGLTSETSDQLHGRLSFSKISPKRQWWIRAGGGVTTSRTYGKKRISETDVSNYTFDSEYRRDGKDGYRFVSLAANIKNRSPHSSTYLDQSGYWMLSGGYGRRLFPGLECEVALADITQQRAETENRLTPVYSFRMKTPLGPALTLDGDTHLVQPFSDDNLVDSRVNLTYKFTDNLSMRLSYVANNILGTTLSRSEWDKSIRVSFVFSGVN